jgi:hypothetical protein
MIEWGYFMLGFIVVFFGGLYFIFNFDIDLDLTEKDDDDKWEF